MKKKLILVVTALTLCAAIAVGGTLAYLQDKSNEVKNIFTFDSGGDGSDSDVKIEIAETKWSKKGDFQFVPYSGTEWKLGTRTDAADSAKPTENKGWGVERQMIDGARINKNPVVRNNTQVKSYTGVAVTMVGNVTWADFDKVATLDDSAKTSWNLSTPGATKNGWSYVKQSADKKTRYFVYNTALAGNTATFNNTASLTTALFDTVKVKIDASNPIGDNRFGNMKPFRDNEGFQMDIVAYAVQAELEEDEGSVLATSWNNASTGAKYALGVVYPDYFKA